MVDGGAFESDDVRIAGDGIRRRGSRRHATSGRALRSGATANERRPGGQGDGEEAAESPRDGGLLRGSEHPGDFENSGRERTEALPRVSARRGGLIRELLGSRQSRKGSPRRGRRAASARGVRSCIRDDRGPRAQRDQPLKRWRQVDRKRKRRVGEKRRRARRGRCCEKGYGATGTVLAGSRGGLRLSRR